MFRFLSILFLILASHCVGSSQDPAILDSIVSKQLVDQPLDSLSAPNDSIPLPIDSVSKQPNVLNQVTISTDSLPSQVVYGSRDSNYLDVKKNQIHLYGDAYVEFQDMTIKGAYLMFDFNTNIAHAYKSYDSLGLKIDKATFKNTQQEFNYNELRFNFKTKKGVVLDAISKEGEFFLHGNRTKFISKDSDSLQIDDKIFNENAIITTCNLEHPHYGIRTTKLKVVPDKVAVMGPSILEIAGIPTPIILPFGFFPLVSGRSSGLIFPSDFTYDRELGLTFRNIGYYFPINEYVDLKLVGDIYTNGSYAARAQTSYKKRYAFTGRAELGYSRIIRESPLTGFNETSTSFNIRLTHAQDPKSHPYRSINGSIDIQSNQYASRTFNDYDAVFNNKLSSNLNFTHSMPGTPFTFAIGLNHRQDNQTRKVTLTLPDVKLNMNTIFPFKRKNAGSNAEKWYERVTLKYDGAFKNFVETTDTTLFTTAVFDELQYGFSHKASTSASFRVAKYFNVTPSASYDELWYFRTLEKNYDPTLLFDTISVDTTDIPGEVFVQQDTTFGTFNDQFVNGFETFRKFNTSVNVSTQIFGTKRFSKGFIRGIRHVIKPTIGFTYTPDTKAKYIQEVSVNPNENFIEPQEYNPFQGGIYSAPLNEKAMSLTYGFTNQIEAKYFSKKDSTEKTFKIFNNINVNGNYNFAKDSLKWSDVNISGNTTLIKDITTLNFTMRYTPYQKLNNRSIDETVWSAKGRLLAFNNFNTTLNTRITAKKIKALFTREKEKDSKNTDKVDQKDKRNKNEVSFYSWFENFSLNHTYQINIERIDERDTFTVRANSIQIRGSVPLSEKWNLELNNIAYDIKNKTFVYPSFTFARDLHCWRMNFSWVPDRNIYSFFIGVKSNQLSFLKGDYKQNNPNKFF